MQNAPSSTCGDRVQVHTSLTVQIFLSLSFFSQVYVIKLCPEQIAAFLGQVAQKHCVPDSKARIAKYSLTLATQHNVLSTNSDEKKLFYIREST